MKKRSVLFMLFLVFSIAIMANDGSGNKSAKNTTNLAGKVIDKNSGEYLAGVAVKLEGSDQVIYTDFDGNFEFTSLKPGAYKISTNMISYKENTEKVKVNLADDNQIEFKLETLSEK